MDVLIEIVAFILVKKKTLAINRLAAYFFTVMDGCLLKFTCKKRKFWLKYCITYLYFDELL